MAKKQTVIRFLRTCLGWVLIVMGLPFLIGSVVAALAAIFGGLETESVGENLAFFVTCLIAAAFFFGVVRCGFRLKKTAKPSAPAAQPGGTDAAPATEERPPAQPRKQTGEEETPSPVQCVGTDLYISMKGYFSWRNQNPSAAMYEQTGIMALTERMPVIRLYEDGQQTRAYCLQTEGDEDFTGKFFHYSVRLGLTGNPPAPTAQIDGFISDTPEERKMNPGEIGYRMEGHFLAAGGELAKMRYAALRGQDLVAKGLKYPGYTTPASVRLIGICPECRQSFAFHGYAFYMMQYDVAYSDDGLDCCAVGEPVKNKETWACETGGKRFRYYNSFCCPHCGEPYIDYQKYPQNKAFGVSGCVHLGRKRYDAPFTQQEETETSEKTAGEYLDDITFIRDMKHAVSGPWHQYDVLLAARGYGWDFMVRWADYMASADISNISEVLAGELQGRMVNMTEQFRKNGNKLEGLAEISAERGTLSIAGNSQALQKPVKLVWINQTNTVRLFTLEEDALLVRKYVETAARWSFHTENAMKLGKPIPEDK